MVPSGTMKSSPPKRRIQVRVWREERKRGNEVIIISKKFKKNYYEVSFLIIVDGSKTEATEVILTHRYIIYQGEIRTIFEFVPR